MDMIIVPSSPGGIIKAISSKSHAHRILISAALSCHATKVHCKDVSDDIKATVSCLNALGASIRYEDGVFTVSPIREVPKRTKLDAKESGTTLRLILPVVSALGVECEFDMAGRLPHRPLSPLTDELMRHDVRIYKTSDKVLKVSGKLKGGNYEIPGDISSQFISGLLFALPLTDEGGKIEVTGALTSRGYIDMTLETLKEAGIKIATSIKDGKRSFSVPGGQVYDLPREVTIDGDWSNAAFWLAMGALSDGEVTCSGLNERSKQKDKEIINLLKRFGAEISTGDDSFTVKKNVLHGIEIDAIDIPDLVPVLAVLGAGAIGVTKIFNAARLRLKESDRLRSLYELINGLDGEVTETEDGLIINGTGKLKGGTVDSFNDHRIAMASAVASCISEDSIFLKNAGAVNKSYPGFWNDFVSLGGNLKREER